MKSLRAQGSQLAVPRYQMDQLGQALDQRQLPTFESKCDSVGRALIRPLDPQILQINVGKMCNQVCKHCHVDAGPDRKEIMTRETMQLALDVLDKVPTFTTVDLTGGAPEMNPHFRWFVEEVRARNKSVIVRCNLTIILANKVYNDLPQFFARNAVHVVSSLPFYQKGKTDRQRGDGVFDKSIRALQMLNEVGYGKLGTGLLLDLVYNPTGAFMPGSQKSLEADYKRELRQLFGIEFNQLFTITNMPISRFLEYLIESGNLEDYMEKLVAAFNPSAIEGLMCRNTISVSWDGFLYDCDFNQMLDMKVQPPNSQHLRDFNLNLLMERKILTDQHCYGCTAGSGSSCGGQIVEEPAS